MAKGKGQTTLIGIQGIVQHTTAPDYDFLYRTSTIRDPRYYIGDRVVLPDGRVFRYGYSAGALNPSKGAQNSVTFLDSDNTQAEAVIGAKKISITLSAAAANAEYFGTAEKMIGAYFSQPDGTHRQFRRIVKHGVGVSADVITIELDAALSKTIATNSFYEILPNPYGYLVNNGGTHVSVMSIPNVVVADNSYFWGQTWGPIWINVNSSGVGSGAYDRTVVFAEGGGLDQMSESATVVQRQVAGFIIDKTSGGTWTNPPMVMLQISP